MSPYAVLILESDVADNAHHFDDSAQLIISTSSSLIVTPAMELCYDDVIS